MEMRADRPVGRGEAVECVMDRLIGMAAWTIESRHTKVQTSNMQQE